MCSICKRPDDIRLVQYLSYLWALLHLLLFIYMAPSSLHCLQPFHLYTFFSTLPCAFVCVRYSMLEGEILSSTCRFFYGLKFCASKGRTNVLVLLSSRRAVYTRSTDGMSSKNSLSFPLSLSLSFFRSRYNNP
jgi:hypothetical protein